MTVTTMSESEALEIKKGVDAITSMLERSRAKAGFTWAQRVTMQQNANNSATAQNYSQRLTEINAIFNDPINIERWKKEKDAKEAEIKRLADIETERLRLIEVARIEAKRLQDIEDLRLNTEFRVQQMALQEKNRLLYLSIKSDEIDSFYDFDAMQEQYQLEKNNPEVIQKIYSVEPDVKDIETIPKQIPLETATPILLVLGVGLVSYYLLKGNKK